MPEQASPRTRVKALLKGDAPEAPLLMPIVFALGSRLENVTAAEFANNPTKIANALRQIRASLKVDGICCYFDESLEADAMAQAGLARGKGSVESILSKGRVPVVLEVLKRARFMLKDEPALMARLTGPLTLAAQLACDLSGGLLDRECLEFCAEVGSTLAKAYLDAGADVISIVETSLPLDTPELVQWWASVLDPIVNVIRFYEAVPLLILADQLSAETARLLAGRTWDCILSPSVTALRTLAPQEWKHNAVGLGMAVPAEGLAGVPEDQAVIQQLMADFKPVLLTTLDDLPVGADLKHFAANLQQQRSGLALRT